MKILNISLGDMDKWDRLTPEEEGIAWRVLRKLAAYDGAIPADDRGARYVTMDVRRWRSVIKRITRDFDLGFHVHNGSLRHRRLDADIKRNREKKDERREIGLAASKVRWGDQMELPLMTGIPPEMGGEIPPEMGGETNQDNSRNPLKSLDAKMHKPKPNQTKEKKERKRGGKEPPSAPPEVHAAYEVWRTTASAIGLPIGCLSKKTAAELASALAVIGPDGWRELIDRVAASQFLCGCNPRAWRCDLSWLLVPDNRIKIEAGNYDNRAPAANGKSVAALLGGKVH